MAKQYRFTRVVESNGPQNAKERDQQKDPYANMQQQPDGGYVRGDKARSSNAQPLYIVQQPNSGGTAPRSSGRAWMWAFIALLAAAAIVVMAVWMTGVASSLHHLNHTTQQNARALAAQKAQLTGIHGQLQHISQQLSHISNQIGAFFRSVMQAISSGKF